MEIRLMKSSELQSVILLAKGVYEKCARGYIGSQMMVQQFYDYIRAESLWQNVQSGELFVWGALEGRVLCGIGAMQSSAHITMLYVHPKYQRQGIGSMLLSHMAEFAAVNLHARRVTTHAIPTAAAPFFYHRGYVQMKNVPPEPDMLPLEYCFAPVREKEADLYPTRPVKAKTIIWIIVVFFLLAAAISGGTVFYYLIHG